MEIGTSLEKRALKQEMQLLDILLSFLELFGKAFFVPKAKTHGYQKGHFQKVLLTPEK